MEKFGEDKPALKHDTLGNSLPSQSITDSSRLDSQEVVAASTLKAFGSFVFETVSKVFDCGVHKRKDCEDSRNTDVLALRELHAMEMAAAKENFQKLFTQKEKEMEAAVEEINALLTHKNELAENVNKAQCRISELEQQGQMRDEQAASLYKEIQMLQENRTTLEANERKLHLQIQSFEKERANEGQHKNGSYVDSSATPVLLDTVVRGLHIASRNFTTEFIRTNDHGNTSAVKLFAEVQFSKRSHVKYAHQAHLSAIFFSDFEREDFGDDAQLANLSLPHQHPTAFFEEYEAFSNASNFPVSNVLPSKFTKAFGGFCCRKYLGIFHKKLGLEESILQCSKQVDGKDPKANKYDLKLLTTFFQLARIVWMLHRLAFSFEPNARVIRVGSDADFNSMYMMNVTNENTTRDEADSIDDEDMMLPQVALVLLPGFSVCKCIVKSLVYLTQPQAST